MPNVYAIFIGSKPLIYVADPEVVGLLYRQPLYDKHPLTQVIFEILTKDPISFTPSGERWKNKRQILGVALYK